MTFCRTCGKENADDAEYYNACGAPFVERYAVENPKDVLAEKSPLRKNVSAFPYGGAICGAIFGCFIIVIGLSIVFNWNVWFWFGPLMLLLFGILIVLGSIYSIKQRRSA